MKLKLVIDIRQCMKQQMNMQTKEIKLNINIFFQVYDLFVLESQFILFCYLTLQTAQNLIKSANTRWRTSMLVPTWFRLWTFTIQFLNHPQRGAIQIIPGLFAAEKSSARIVVFDLNSSNKKQHTIKQLVKKARIKKMKRVNLNFCIKYVFLYFRTLHGEAISNGTI